jgi:hypothetical protein
VSILIVDGDTKTVQFIREHGPREVADIIDVWLDLNHVEKNVGKKLRELQGVTEAEAAALQKAYCRAVKVSREKNPARGVKPGSEEEKRCAEYLQEYIMSAPAHLFNKDGHVRCKERCPCKVANAAIYNPDHVPHNLGKWIHPGPEDIKYKSVMQVFQEYSSIAMCSQLIFDCTTNPCEGVNSLTWTYYANKTDFEPTSGDAHIRMAQLHKQSGQGAATLGVLKTMGASSSSPEVEKKFSTRDQERKK